MITKDEFVIANDAPIKRDFYQMYPEALDLVKALTDKWDPQESNESDPGIVLLKLAAFFADKLNYTIDKRILEDFMLSCTQEDSMKKLCDMLGYDMHYYKSASTTLSTMWTSDMTEDGKDFYVFIPKFTAITSSENADVNYITTENVILTERGVKQDVLVLEGTINTLKVGDSETIRLYNLDDNKRLYLPEIMIPENGIFIIDDQGRDWKLVSNLYTQTAGSTVYKFGYDSNKKLPYIEFPQDIDSLIGEGFTVNYVRTTGAEGNIKAKVLNKVATISNVYKYDPSDIDAEPEALTEDEEQNLVLSNLSSTISGEDKETIDEAYNSFKKTVGTFDTLVTCRDYANKIYQMEDNTSAKNNLVSNVQVSDIRDDLGKSCKIMTFDTFGVIFRDVSLLDEDDEPVIEPFDLYFYPYGVMSEDYSATSYNKTFKPDYSNNYQIENNLEEYKTIAHNIKYPEATDLYAIKNYYILKCKVVTTYKVNKSQQSDIIKNIQAALYKNFNNRKVDFGEELVDDKILEVVKNSDPRIKNVITLEYTNTLKTMLGSGDENLLAGSSGGYLSSDDAYIDMLVKNILAGRLRMFKYEDSFATNYGEKKIAGIDSIYGSDDPTQQQIIRCDTGLPIDTSIVTSATPYTLLDNENVIFITESYVDDYIYPFGIYFNWSPANTSLTIKTDAEYKLVSGDILYITYTDNDGNAIAIKYEYNGYTKWVNDSSNWYPKANVIIKPNFDLTKTQINAGAKEFGHGSTVQLIMLTGNKQISVLKEQKDELPNSTTQAYYPIFWLTKSGNIENGHILENGEYFFVSDTTKTSLVSYGSGTKIVFNDDESLSLPPLTPASANNVTIEDIANNGLSAIGATDWYNFKPNNAPNQVNKIAIQEMKIITLGKDSQLTKITVSGGNVDNTYRDVTEAEYQFPEDDTPKSLPIVTTSWKVRSRLDLNLNPTVGQVFSKDRHEFVIYTISEQSGATEQAVDIIDLLDQANIPNASVKCNYVIQEPGNTGIDLTLTEEDPSEDSGYRTIKDVKLFIYEDVGVSVNNSAATLSLDNFSEHYTALNDKQMSVTLPINIPTNYQGIMFVYYLSNQEASGNGGELSITEPSSSNNYLKYYNRADTSSYNAIPLTDGLHVVTIDANATELEIAKNDIYDTVIFSDISIIPVANAGIDLEYLGFTTTDPVEQAAIVNKILTKIQNAQGTNTEDIFCYNANLDTNLLINSDPTDTAFWFDNNNVVRKFVISQIDTANSTYEISESSKLK